MSEHAPRLRIKISGIDVQPCGSTSIVVGGNGMKTPDHVFIHEAGHAVVAHALGLRVVCIEPLGDGYRTGFEIPEELSVPGQFLLAAVSLAGAAAQQHAGVEPDDGCAEDLDHAVAGVLEHLGEDPAAWVGVERLPPGVDMAMHLAGALALDILKARWGMVMVVSSKLREAGTLDTEDLRRILDVRE